jgi:ubiquinone/menaquinone biosynthesis C-methylase UbiE
MRGAAPEGARGEREAAELVRQMFARVARRYDLANHVLSFNIDRRWRAHAVRRARAILERPGARALDICCGTGDLTLALAGAAARGGADIPACDAAFQCHQPGASPAEGIESPQAPGAQVLGSDFCHPMLTAARQKITRAEDQGLAAANQSRPDPDDTKKFKPEDYLVGGPLAGLAVAGGPRSGRGTSAPPWCRGPDR